MVKDEHDHKLATVLIENLHAIMKSWDTMKVVRLIEALQDLHAKSSSFVYVGVVSQQMTNKLFT